MSVLVDTSIWIDHFHGLSSQPFQKLLLAGEVCSHTIVIGELACGSLKRRGEVLELLQKLPQLQDADFAETLMLIEEQKLYGCGLGWMDAQLLSCCLIEQVKLWSRDKALHAAAVRLGISYASE